MEIHYLDLFPFLFILFFIPFLQTIWWLDVWVVYAWIYAAMTSKLIWFYSDLKNSLQVKLEVDQNMFLLVLALFSLFIKKKVSTNSIAKILAITGVVNLIFSIVALPFDDQFTSGLIPNKAMNSIFNTMLLPYTFSLIGGWATILVIITAVLAKSVTALVSLLCMGVTWIYLSNETRKIYQSGLLAFGCALSAIFFNSRVWGPHERLRIWKESFHLFSIDEWIVGHGPSSFQVLSVYAQGAGRGVYDTFFDMYMHSDPLQYLYEYGVIGLLPLSIGIYYLIKYAQRREILAMAGLLGGCLFYYPMHFYPHLLVFFCIVKIVVNTYLETNVRSLFKTSVV